MAGGLSLGLAYLTHPNGVVFLGVSAAWLVLTWRDRPSRSAVAFIVPCALLVATYTCWQYRYMATSFPTRCTQRLAISPRTGSTGLQVSAAFVWQPPYAVILVIALSAYALVRGQWRWWSKTTYLAAMISVYASYIVFIGGDQSGIPAVRAAGGASGVSLLPASRRSGRLDAAHGGHGVDRRRAGAGAPADWPAAAEPGREDPAARIGTVVGNTSPAPGLTTRSSR